MSDRILDVCDDCGRDCWYREDGIDHEGFQRWTKLAHDCPMRPQSRQTLSDVMIHDD
jgi:hypothetical protein